MQEKLRITFRLRYFLLPKNNHWLKRVYLVFAFIFFDYFVTLLLCQTPYQEANLFARGFMVVLGVPLGLTLFVLTANLPIYMTLSLDSHIVRFPFKIAMFVEIFVDVVFAWFVAGMHFSGGTSWFWYDPEMIRQSLGALLYFTFALLLIRPYNPHYEN